MKKLTIGFDAKRAFHNKTGLGNYSRDLIKSLLHYYPRNDYILFTPTAGTLFSAVELNQETGTAVVQSHRKAFGALWRALKIPKLLKKQAVDIYHGLSAELPVFKPRNTRYVVTIHDLIFMHFPDLYPKVDRAIYKKKTIAACKNADVIIAISEQTRNDLVTLLHVPAKKIKVIYQTCNPIFEQPQSNEILAATREKYKLPKQYILNVGTLEKRKNALVIVQALNNLPENIHAVFVGKKTEYQETLDAYITRHNLSSRIHFLSDVNNTELASIYQQALVFVYPSIFEGFGIPVIEALKSGTPVIAARGSCLEEAGGPYSKYIAPYNVTELVTQIALIYNNKQSREEMISQGLRYAQKFSAARLAEDTMAVYKGLL